MWITSRMGHHQCGSLVGGDGHQSMWILVGWYTDQYRFPVEGGTNQFRSEVEVTSIKVDPQWKGISINLDLRWR